MKNIFRFLIILSLATLISCDIITHTRKPQSDIKTKSRVISKIDSRIEIHYLNIVKIDSTLNLFKSEALIGITIKGEIDKSKYQSAFSGQHKDDTIYYFKSVEFIDAMDNYSKKINIEIIPELKTSKKELNKCKLGNIKYLLHSGRIEFELYLEKKLVTPTLGTYEVNLACGEKKETIWLHRRK